MKAVLHKIKIWFKNNNIAPKEIEFFNNKVNVITGDSSKGKSSIFAIINYCLLSHNSNIAYQIGEVASCFGIELSFNNIEYVICRKAPQKGVASEEIFFKQGISMPQEEPITTNTISIGREALNNISESNSKYQFRDTLLYVFLTENIIADQFNFFDTKYINSLNNPNIESIFYKFLGADNEYSDQKRNEYEKASQALEKLNKKGKYHNRLLNKYLKEVEQIFEICVARHFLPLQDNLQLNEKETLLSKFVQNNELSISNDNIQLKIEELKSQKSKLLHKKGIYDKYGRQYSRSVSKLKEYSDCLKPIEVLNQKFKDQLIDYSLTKEFISHLENSLNETKKQIANLPPEPLADYKEKYNLICNKINEITRQIEIYEHEDQNYNKKKYFVLGEICYRIKKVLDSKPSDLENKLSERLELENNIKELELILKGIQRRRDEYKSKLEESIKSILLQFKTIDKNIKDLSPIFYVEKMRLMMVEESSIWGTKYPIDNLGSKSNDMFLHICFFLGFHKYILQNASESSIPTLLLIDQPSQPYFDKQSNSNSSDSKSDEKKLKNVFEILNNFISYVNQVLNQNFQIILLEHAEQRYWKNLANFQTIEEFFGKGLYPEQAFETMN